MRPMTILARHHALSRFFAWLVAENELATSPMASIRAPAARLPEPQVLTGEEIAGLLAACDGDAFEDVRESASFSIPACGARSSPLCSSTISTPRLPNRLPRRPWPRPARRTVRSATARALERYLAARALHHSAHLPHLWLGRRGRLTDRGVERATRHRGRLAGLPALSAQRLRHTNVQQYLADGGSGRDLMRLVGWKSRQLLGRYRTEALAERPRAEWLRLGDRL
jgi:site-specific recombinase XerD